MRVTRAQIAFAALALALAAWVAIGTGSTGDYATAGPVAGDNPAPAIEDLIHGRVAGAARAQPLMGLTSLLLRAPAAALAGALGGGNLTAYRLGALACMLVLVPFAGWVAMRASAGVSSAAGLLAVALVAAGPATRDAIGAGHPEEILAALLALGAVLAATADRPALAGALLGLAIGSKQWALVAAVPCLAGAPGRRLRVVACAAAAAAMTVVPLPLLDLDGFHKAGHAVGASHFANALGAWWPFSAASAGAQALGAPVRTLPVALDRALASAAPLIAALAIAAVVCERARRGSGAPLPRAHAFALLALLALVRCLADPLPLHYYYVPVVAASAAWEIERGHRIPLVTALTLGAVAALFSPGLRVSPDLLSALTLAGAAALAARMLLGMRQPHGGRTSAGGLKAAT